jgi:hypothetical protein
MPDLWEQSPTITQNVSEDCLQIRATKHTAQCIAPRKSRAAHQVRDARLNNDLLISYMAVELPVFSSAGFQHMYVWAIRTSRGVAAVSLPKGPKTIDTKYKCSKRM